MLSRVRLTVLVDDYVTDDGAGAGALPAHGLGLLLKLERSTGSGLSLLVDGGPLPDLLLHNATSLETSLDGVTAGFATLWSSHHVLALLKLARERRLKLHLPPPPGRGADGFEELGDLGAVVVPTWSPAYNERVLLLVVNGGPVAVAGCSAYGVDEVLASLASAEERLGVRVKALVGGFNLSTRDVYGLRLLVKFAEERDALVVPLHSTSLEARERLCRKLGLEEVPGVGTELTFEW